MGAAGVALGAFAPGCTGVSDPTGGEGAPALSGSAAAPTRPTVVFCPSHRFDYATTIDPTAAGVAVTITIVDPEDHSSLDDLRSMVRYLVHASATLADPTEALRAHAGVTGDKNNNCPIVMKDTVVTSTLVDGGVRVSVAAKSSDAPVIAELQATANRHLETIKAMHALK